jgi:hypothetical protein
MYIRNVQRAFNLPVLPRYSQGYVTLLKKLIALQIFSIPNYKILALLDKERRILEMLNVRTVLAAPTWFEDMCRVNSGPTRLLFTGHDLGHPLDSRAIQTELNFETRPPELFSSEEIGEDIHRELLRYRDMLQDLMKQLKTERETLRDSLHWTNQILKRH